MSEDALLWAVGQIAGGPQSRFVLLILAGCADEQGRADVTCAKIAELTEMREAQVRAALRQLRGRGLLERDRIDRPEGGCYRLTMTAADAALLSPFDETREAS
ncbi:hypothetical protein A1351_23135 [Methylosinus sp. R-45379]|uniref:Rrf2 family transcriptional regulator n=1 Tax=Methylosinus sp. R-45379 TaxID=980563 RepID=UPI0007C93FB2|nr:Rrf2 family transcriptional regulator [Methylosinus sp. R-45379]OAI30019.1 hypothetical protein A1351_23135 [Methylosinus sp. R-45379]